MVGRQGLPDAVSEAAVSHGIGFSCSPPSSRHVHSLRPAISVGPPLPIASEAPGGIVEVPPDSGLRSTKSGNNSGCPPSPWTWRSRGFVEAHEPDQALGVVGPACGLPPGTAALLLDRVFGSPLTWLNPAGQRPAFFRASSSTAFTLALDCFNSSEAGFSSVNGFSNSGR